MAVSAYHKYFWSTIRNRPLQRVDRQCFLKLYSDSAILVPNRIGHELPAGTRILPDYIAFRDAFGNKYVTFTN